ncbi:MAG: alpha/beta hydrolase [Gemmatimonadota bacterium]
MRERVATLGPERGLVGIFTEAGASPNRETPVVLIPNSGIVHHVGVGRLHTRAARRLADRGFPSFRFDYSGIGDSKPTGEAMSIGDAVLRDLDTAADYVREQGFRRIVVFGLCSGGRDALELAVRDESVVGTFAIDLMSDFVTLKHQVVHFAPRLLRWSSWKNLLLGRNARLSGAARALAGAGPEVEDSEPWPEEGPRSRLERPRLAEMLGQLVRRDVRMYFAFSNGLEDNYNHAGQFASALPGVGSDPRITSRFFSGADHVFSDRAQQSALLDAFEAWMSGGFDSTGGLS